jgi:hypothetical protein
MIIENPSYKVEGGYISGGAIRTYRYVTPEFTGTHAEMNSGQYVSEIQTILVLPDHVIYVSDNDANDQSYEIEDWEPDNFEYIEGSEENVLEVYEQYVR